MKQIIFLFLVFTSLFSFAQGGEENTPYLMATRQINTCSGILYDSGGFEGSYSNNENIIMTICPDVPGSFVKLDFTTFLIENNADFLTIFDGVGVGGTEMGLVPYTGTNSPGVVKALAGGTGCLTLRFTSDATNVAPGFSARITCEAPCQDIVARVIETLPLVDPLLGKVCPEDFGTVRVCVGEEVFFKGAATFSGTGEGAIYAWDFKNGTRGVGTSVVTSYDEPGAYRVNLVVTDPNDCRNNNVATVTVQVSTTKDVEFNLGANKPIYCLGEEIQLTANPEMIPFEFEPVPPLAGTTYLPDGSGDVYTTTITVDQYCDEQVLFDLNDFSICVNLEHSYTGDLDIVITAPNGVTVPMFLQAGNGNYFGHPIDDTVSGPGIGSTYCFTANAATTIAGGQTEPTNVNTPGNTYIPGDYLPIGDFADLLGTSINGQWTISITDHLRADDGYIFWWSVNFSPDLAPADLSFTPTAETKRWLPANGLTNVGNDGNATVRPEAPGTYTYTYELVDDFGCVFTDEITVEVFNPLVLGTPINLNECKDEVGNATFNLRDVQPSISTNPGFVFEYYGSEANALARINAIPTTQIVNILDGPKNIWVRVFETGVVTPCVFIETFKLIVNNCDLDLNELPALQICESVNAADNVFDLTVQTPRVFNATPGYKVYYYENQDDALLDENRIIDQLTLAYPGTNGQVIFVRVQNEAIPTEFGTTSFSLVVAPKPVVFLLTPAIGCPITPAKDLASFYLPLNSIALTGGGRFLEVSYYRNQLEAELGDPNGVLPDTFISGPTTIWARVLNTVTGCYNVGPLELRIENLPLLNYDLIIDHCDNNNDGIGEFDLDEISRRILGTAITPDLVISYHLSSADASLNSSPLMNPYSNNRPTEQIIYARVAFARSTCFEIVPVKLRVTQSPVIVDPTPIFKCVEVLGREVIYDLTTKTAEILNGLDPNSYNVTFHVQQTHANQGILPIDTPSSFSNAISPLVWVRVQNINTGCFSVVSISLRTVLGPTIQPIANYVICDGVEDDGFAIFDLHSRIPAITNGQLGMLVSFHVNQVDAEGNTRELVRNYQNIVAYNQTIFVRIQSAASGCVVIKPMNLMVVALPVLNIPTTPVAICNSSANGQGTFNLLELVERLQNGIPGLDIHFYETQANAMLGLPSDRIVRPQAYNNLNPANPVVWVRANNFATGCFVVKPLYLLVTAAPIMPIRLDDIVKCTEMGSPNISMFDLTVQTPVILAAQTSNDPGSLVVTYYISEADAEVGATRSITGPTAFTNTVNPQTIWVRVDNVDTKCYSINSFVIKVSNPVVLSQPLPLVVCQTSLPNTGSHVFDLTQRELAIVGGTLIFGTEFHYFRTKADADRNENWIDNPGGYTNTSNPQTIWVVVTNREGCRSMVTLTIKVTPLPEPNMTPKALEACEGEAGEGIGVFDLTLSEDDIRNHDDNLNFDYYTSEVEAIAGGTFGKIEFPGFYTSVSRTVWVRVSNQPTNIDNSCFVIVPLQLIVNPVPFINPLRPLMGCEQNTDGFYTFNLADKHSEILNGRNPQDFDILFFLTRALADVGTTPPMALTFTNVLENEQTIWVRLVNKRTGCFYVAPLRLKVEEQVFAYDVATSPMVFCDDNDVVPVNDGFTRIDLTVNDAQIIGVQNVPVADVRVVYFASEQDFLNNRPIADPTQFVNTSSPQTIIAVVRYIAADLFCEANVEFQVVVNKRPELIAIEGGFICQDLSTGKITPFLIDSKLDSSLYNFIWKFNGGVIADAKLSYYEATREGRYTVTTTDKVTGCPSFNEITVIVSKVAPFSVTIDENAGDRDKIAEDGSQTIIVNVEDQKTPPGVYEFALNDGAYQNSNIFYNVTAGEHLVWVRDRLTGACAVSKLVSVMNYPKFFTPNGDGHNDTWNIKGLSDQPDAKIYIFDRFGKLLKQLSPSGEGWDGMFGGRPVPATDYWFTVEYNDLQGNRREFKGHFSLKR